ncbi:MAG: hypothetical protein ACI9MC_000871 [Kiritimatiellia bacterium]
MVPIAVAQLIHGLQDLFEVTLSVGLRVDLQLAIGAGVAEHG